MTGGKAYWWRLRLVDRLKAGSRGCMEAAPDFRGKTAGSVLEKDHDAHAAG